MTAALAAELQFGDGDGGDPPQGVALVVTYAMALHYVAARGPVFRAAVNAAMARAMALDLVDTETGESRNAET